MSKNIQKIVVICLVVTISTMSLFSAEASLAKAEKLARLDNFLLPAAFDNDIKLTVINENTTTLSVVQAEEEKADRAARLDAYFKKRNMPLAGYGKKFVEVAEKCEIDWRLLPAIGVRESSGGKRMMNNNPFGWGSAKIKFKDFNDAIEGVSDNLCGFNPGTARYYKDRTTYERLWYYNGTVINTYPGEVMDIMDMF